ncbi:MAG: arsenate reductase ArsC [Anaerolineales bacterium]
MNHTQNVQRKVLVLCTGNSARSQMSEGLINHLLGDQWTAYSAGTQPSGYVHPQAIEVMEELGIDISDQRSKSVAEFRHIDFDLVITVCDNAAKNCPTWLGDGEVKHIGFPDPAAVEGSPEEKRAAFRVIRDAIRRRVVTYVENWQPDEEEPISNLKFSLKGAE